MTKPRSTDASATQPPSTHRTAGCSSLGIGDFVASMTHEIANMFNTITINMEMLKYLIDADQAPRAAEVLRRLGAECARCNRLIQSMQRFGSALHCSDPTEIAVREQVDACIALAHEEMPGDRPDVDVRERVADLRIRADAAALHRGMAGLLHNALQAGARRIQIDIDRDGEHVVIDFRDDGTGIAGDIRERVMEPFFSTRRSDGCCGLGLTLMHDLAQRHGGGLSVAANEPQGAHVSVRLPALA